MKKIIFQLIRYGAVGGFATLVDYGTYYLLTRSLQIIPSYANPFAYAAGNVVSYLGHHFITFRSHSRVTREYPRFALVTAAGIILSQVIILFLIKIGLHDLVAKAGSVLITGLFNYLANRVWTFNRSVQAR
jgi:putative flippase GtrA